MADRPRVVVLTAEWWNDDETAFVFRSVAGAATRFAQVDVLVPGTPGLRRADGAFDVEAVGTPPAGATWPPPEDVGIPSRTAVVVVVDAADTTAMAVAHRLAPESPVLALWSRTARAPLPPGTSTATFGPQEAGSVARPTDPPDATVLELHVPVSPTAAQRRHNGIGFTGYLLVLTDRDRGAGCLEEPTPLVAWLATAFPRRHLLAVEDGIASVWQWRSLRGSISVDTRMDLWRLLAHAALTIDLRPGRFVGRECVESLRYGVPIVVPADSIGAEHAAGGGGLWYRDVAELVGCVERLSDPTLRSAMSLAGRGAADARYGDPARLVSRLFETLGGLGAVT